MTTDSEVRYNLENIIEEIAALKMSQQRDELLLYGDSGVDLTGLKDRVKDLESAMDNAIKNINGLPQDVQELRGDFNALRDNFNAFIDTDKRRVNTIRGIGIGLGINAVGIGTVLIKVFS